MAVKYLDTLCKCVAAPGQLSNHCRTQFVRGSPRHAATRPSGQTFIDRNTLEAIATKAAIMEGFILVTQ